MILIKLNNLKNGFSLIELLIVISIIGILSNITTVYVKKYLLILNKKKITNQIYFFLEKESSVLDYKHEKYVLTFDLDEKKLIIFQKYNNKKIWNDKNPKIIIAQLELPQKFNYEVILKDNVISSTYDWTIDRNKTKLLKLYFKIFSKQKRIEEIKFNYDNVLFNINQNIVYSS